MIPRNAGRGQTDTDNDRYVYVNVDDHPDPMRELRRLMDIQLSINHRIALGLALSGGRFDEALRSAEKLAAYGRLDAQTHVTLGFVAYLAGQPDRAAAAFSRAKELMRPEQFRQAWDATVARPLFCKVLEDPAFVARITGP